MSNADDLRAEARRLDDRAAELETQLGASEVQQMYAERRYADIVQAKQDGRLDDYLTSTPTDTKDN